MSTLLSPKSEKILVQDFMSWGSYDAENMFSLIAQILETSVNEMFKRSEL